MRALAERFVDGRLSERAFSRMTDEEIEAALTDVPGIGPWTARGFLLVALDRPDVFLSGDLALAEALARRVESTAGRPRGAGAQTGEESMSKQQQLELDAILRQGQLDLGADVPTLRAGFNDVMARVPVAARRRVGRRWAGGGHPPRLERRRHAAALRAFLMSP